MCSTYPFAVRFLRPTCNRTGTPAGWPGRRPAKPELPSILPENILCAVPTAERLKLVVVLIGHLRYIP